MLIIFSGFPGVGKTTLSKIIASQLGATYLRIDSIEQALKNSSLKINFVEEAGYMAAYNIAKDNLQNGQVVVSDSVNSIELARDGWLSVAREENVTALEIEVICSDKDEHKNRVEARTADLPNHIMPTWQEVLECEYDPYPRVHIVIDTAGKEIDFCVEEILSQIKS